MVNRIALMGLATAVAALALNPIPAMAQSTPPTGEQNEMLREMGEELDALKDLRASPGASTDPKALFAYIDENGDGRIDRTEWRLRSMRILAIRDTDGDGKLSREEIPGVGADAFAAADTDGDGFLTGLELNQAEFMRFEAIDPDSTEPVDIDTFVAFVQRLQ